MMNDPIPGPAGERPVFVRRLGWSLWAKKFALVAFVAVAFPVPVAAQALSSAGTLPEIVDSNDGEATLLLLPCMSCRWRSFDTFMERNKSRYRMIAVTVPGFGGTPAPPIPRNTSDPLWHQNAVAALERLIEERKITDLVIVGHSFGGVLGTALAARLGDRVSGMIFIDAWPTSDRSWFSDSEEERVTLAFRVTTDQAHLLTDFDAWQSFNAVSSQLPIDRRLAYHGWFMATSPEVVIQYWRENHLIDLNPLLTSIKAPMLDLKALPTGRDSAAYALDRRHHWQENCPTCEVNTILLRETGHFIHETAPLDVDRFIEAFLRERRGGGAPSR